MEKIKITGDEPATGYGFANEVAHQEFSGLTIRQQFAAMAMQGIIATSECFIDNYVDADAAANAVSYADALIAELNK